MGLCNCKKKKHVSFHPDIKIDRLEESIIRYNYIRKTVKNIQETNDSESEQRLKGTLSLLIDSYVKRCGENIHVTTELQHMNRLNNVMIYKQTYNQESI